MKNVMGFALAFCIPMSLLAQTTTKKEKCRVVEKALYKGIHENDLKKVSDNFMSLKKLHCFSTFTAQGDVEEFSEKFELETIEDKEIKSKLDSVLNSSKKNVTLTTGSNPDKEKVGTDESLFRRKPMPVNCKDVVGAGEQSVCFQKFIMKHVSDHISHPKEAFDVTEKHYVSFDINEQGKVENAKVVRGSNKFLKAEALRVINLLPKVLPGMEGDKAIRVKFTIPIMFRAR